MQENESCISVLPNAWIFVIWSGRLFYGKTFQLDIWNELKLVLKSISFILIENIFCRSLPLLIQIFQFSHQKKSRKVLGGVGVGTGTAFPPEHFCALARPFSQTVITRPRGAASDSSGWQIMREQWEQARGYLVYGRIAPVVLLHRCCCGRPACFEESFCV